MPEILVTATGDQWSPLQNGFEFQMNEFLCLIIFHKISADIAGKF